MTQSITPSFFRYVLFFEVTVLTVPSCPAGCAPHLISCSLPISPALNMGAQALERRSGRSTLLQQSHPKSWLSTLCLWLPIYFLQPRPLAWYSAVNSPVSCVSDGQLSTTYQFWGNKGPKITHDSAVSKILTVLTKQMIQFCQRTNCKEKKGKNKGGTYRFKEI